MELFQFAAHSTSQVLQIVDAQAESNDPDPHARGECGPDNISSKGADNYDNGAVIPGSDVVPAGGEDSDSSSSGSDALSSDHSDVCGATSKSEEVPCQDSERGKLVCALKVAPHPSV